MHMDQFLSNFMCKCASMCKCACAMCCVHMLTVCWFVSRQNVKKPFKIYAGKIGAKSARTTAKSASTVADFAVHGGYIGADFITVGNRGQILKDGLNQDGLLMNEWMCEGDSVVVLLPLSWTEERIIVSSITFISDKITGLFSTITLTSIQRSMKKYPNYSPIKCN